MVLRKTPAQIALMRQAGRVVAEMHEECTARPSRARRPPTSTRRPRGARPPARPVELPQLPRVPGRRLHLAQRGDRARHPRRPRCSTTATSSRSTAARSSRAGTPTPRSRSRSATIDEESQRLIDVTRGRRSTPRSRQVRAGQPARRHRRRGARASVTAAGFAVVREYVGHGIGTAMHEEPDVPELRAGRAGACGCGTGMVLAIEPMVNAGRADDPAPRRRLDRRHRRRQPVRALRAHRRHHRRRPRGPDGP